MHGVDAMAKRTHTSVKRANRGTASQENSAPEQRRRRLEPEDREREIIDGAIAFFAEVGFDGGLRDLAKSLGITHQNVFRYFPTKEALIERVYKEIYLSRWQPEWVIILHNAVHQLESRLAT